MPFAFATVIGGIDNTESAAAAGDDYRASDILLTEAVATIIAGCCGGVIQNTPYIGHPAYKAMGARAGYTLATGLVIGVGAAIGIVSLLVSLLPDAAVAPILIFIGLQITAQAFLASPARHAASDRHVVHPCRGGADHHPDQRAPGPDRQEHRGSHGVGQPPSTRCSCWATASS